MKDSFKSFFQLPGHGDQEVLYFCGNSLGPLPHSTRESVNAQLDKWGTEAVEGHFANEDPWYSLAESLKGSLSRIVGAKPVEVAAMGTLSANLHHLMASFYQPSGRKRKILIEPQAFPSDRYIAAAQLRWHGLNPKEDLLIAPSRKDHLIDEDELCDYISQNADEIALILLPGVQFHTGQFIDADKIGKVARKHNIVFGLDLAHAIGNVPLKLHEWEVDFAAWCSYKYLNSGPGAIAGIFVHEKYAQDENVVRLAGWWGYPPETRFAMEEQFEPAAGADGWVQSNPDALSLTALRSSLEIFDRVGMQDLRSQSLGLTGRLQEILEQFDDIEIITPLDSGRRGCQLSFRVHSLGKAFFDGLRKHGVIGDWRVPDIIRLAPAPLYNTHEDLDKLERIIHLVIEELKS